MQRDYAVAWACTCKHTEGGGFASTIHPQKAKGFPFGDAHPKAIHSPDWRPERPLTVLLLQALQKHLPLLLLTACANIYAPLHAVMMSPFISCCLLSVHVDCLGMCVMCDMCTWTVHMLRRSMQNKSSIMQ